MTTRFTPNQNSYSSDETDDEATMSQTNDESFYGKPSQLLTPQNTFQKAFGRPTGK